MSEASLLRVVFAHILNLNHVQRHTCIPMQGVWRHNICLSIWVFMCFYVCANILQVCLPKTAVQTAIFQLLWAYNTYLKTCNMANFIHACNIANFILCDFFDSFRLFKYFLWHESILKIATWQISLYGRQSWYVFIYLNISYSTKQLKSGLKTGNMTNYIVCGFFYFPNISCDMSQATL